MSGAEHQLDRRIAAVATGNRAAARHLFDDLIKAWERDDGSIDPLLDAIAGAARTGTETAVELLLGAVHQLGLARPAITRLIVEPAQVDEVAQSTLVQVERNIERFEGRSKFRTWLYSIARNEALMRLRRESAGATPSERLDSLSVAGSRMSSVIATRATVRDALEQLPEPYRRTLLLRTDDQLDYAEIAVALDVPVGTVRSRLAKARTLLGEQLARA